MSVFRVALERRGVREKVARKMVFYSKQLKLRGAAANDTSLPYELHAVVQIDAHGKSVDLPYGYYKPYLLLQSVDLPSGSLPNTFENITRG